jgi:hypothetical protein
MPTQTYELISTSTTSGTVTSVTISSIPQTYTDLVLVISGVNTSGGQNIYRLNNDSGANYTTTNYFASGTTPSTNTSSGLPGAYIGNYQTSTRYGDTLTILNYRNTGMWKPFYIYGSGGGTSGGQNDFITSAGIWKSTAAISSIVIIVNGGNIAANSIFSLYGVLAGS